MRAVLRRLHGRLYGDFLMGSRLSEYQRFLETAMQAGYVIRSVGDMWHQIRDRRAEATTRQLVLRHDIDTDPATAAAMWEIDRRLGVESSYFFRLSTLDLPLMAQIAGGGSEVSYHYEELSTLIKERGLRGAGAAIGALPEARDRFASNISRLREATGLPMRVVAAHGDFVNRRLGIPNLRILEDHGFRELHGIELDTYDEALLRHLPSRFIDAPPPIAWEPRDPAAAIAAGVAVVSVLVHPRHWHANPLVNARDDLRRVFDEARFRQPGRSR